MKRNFSGLIHKVDPGRVKIGKRLTPADVHVDRLNSNLLHTYLQDERNFVAGRVFPIIPTANRSGYYASYPKAYWMKSQLEKRAPMAETAEVLFKTDNTGTYFVEVVGGHMPIDSQTEANTDAPYDPRADTTAFLYQQMMLYKEIDWAANYFVTGIWGTSTTPGTLWDAASSTPLEDIETGIYTIQANTGMPSQDMVLILGRSTWKTLKNHSELVGRLNAGQTSGPAMVTRDALARLLEIREVMVMGAIQNTADLGQNSSLSFVGGTNDALLVYVNPRPSRLTPSAGYTFAWTGYLGANASGSRLTAWFEPRFKADVMEIETAYSYKLVATDLGYFFLNAVS